MPEANNDAQAAPEQLEAAAPVEAVKKPPTPEEQRELHLAKVAKESDEDRFRRRSAEFEVLLKNHNQQIALARAMFNAPNKPFKNMTPEEQRKWNLRRAEIDKANQAYHMAVRRVHASHVEEDVHFKRLRDAAKPAA